VIRLLAFILLLLPFSANAGAARNDIKPVGEHYPIAIFEKSVNPQNILVIYTRLDGVCNLQMDTKAPGMPTLDFYWLMNGRTYEPLTALEEGVRDRIKVELDAAFAERTRSFRVVLNDLKAMRTDLPDVSAKVTAKADPKTRECSVDAVMRLGPSDGNAVIRLDSIYAKLGGFIIPSPVAITLKGVNTVTGAPVSRTYSK